MSDWLPDIESKALWEIAAAVIGGAFVATLARYRARRRWERRHALEHLNVSINMFADGYLKIRTILERPLEQIIPNLHAQEMVLEAARRTTHEDPIIVLPPKHHGFILNYILNAIAERFAAGAVKADAGHPVASATYALFLTNEPSTILRQAKLRAMLLRRELIEAFPYEDSLPQLERPHHADRIKTLRVAVAKYRKNPELFPSVELSC